MSDYVEVDPANGTEEHAGELKPVHAVDTFTAPEKIVSVVQAVLASPNADPKLRGILTALTSTIGRRLLVGPMLELLPPMDEPAEWDAWLELLAGVALELSSDGVLVDVDEARTKARFVLRTLFEGTG